MVLGVAVDVVVVLVVVVLVVMQLAKLFADLSSMAELTPLSSPLVSIHLEGRTLLSLSYGSRLPSPSHLHAVLHTTGPTPNRTIPALIFSFHVVFTNAVSATVVERVSRPAQ